MRAIIGNTVKTDTADYPCATREEAEALFMSLHLREQERRQRGKDEPGKLQPHPGKPSARH